MIKHYKARTAISVNVVLSGKKNMHVAFASQSDGSSVYVTDNEDVQNALERHHKFGKLFKLSAVPSKPRAAKAATRETAAVARKVKASDLSAAKDYLADTFGISRTSLRSRQSIMDAAKAHNVEFEGL